MKYLAKGVILILSAWLLTACYPESNNPLSTPDTSVVDPDLIGLWYGGEADDPEEHAYYAFLNVGKSELDVIGLYFDDDKDEWIRLSALTTSIGAENFMSLTFEDESGVVTSASSEDEKDPSDKPYILCRYVIGNDGKLSVFLMDEEAMIAALAVEESAAANNNWLDGGDRITAPTEVLRKVIAKGDAEKLFSEVFGVYERRS